MVELKDEQLLSDLLKATSDTTRRAILTLLVQEGAMRVTDLATHYEMSLNAVSKHIKLLEKNGLIKRKTVGRTHWIEVELEPFNLVQTWFKELHSVWEMRLNKLEEILTKGIKS